VAFAIHQNLGIEDFNIAKYFVEDSLQRFEISDSKAHAALVTYGQETNVIFDFNDAQDFSSNLKNKVNQVAFQPGQASLVEILAAACEKIFCNVGGSRDNVPKVRLIKFNYH
jgi:von Willebrand factor type A domain.